MIAAPFLISLVVLKIYGVAIGVVAINSPFLRRNTLISQELRDHGIILLLNIVLRIGMPSGVGIHSERADRIGR